MPIHLRGCMHAYKWIIFANTYVCICPFEQYVCSHGFRMCIPTHRDIYICWEKVYITLFQLDFVMKKLKTVVYWFRIKIEIQFQIIHSIFFNILYTPLSNASLHPRVYVDLMSHKASVCLDGDHYSKSQLVKIQWPSDCLVPRPSSCTNKTPTPKAQGMSWNGGKRSSEPEHSLMLLDRVF